MVVKLIQTLINGNINAPNYNDWLCGKKWSGSVFPLLAMNNLSKAIEPFMYYLNLDNRWSARHEGLNQSFLIKIWRALEKAAFFVCLHYISARFFDVSNDIYCRDKLNPVRFRCFVNYSHFIFASDGGILVDFFCYKNDKSWAFCSMKTKDEADKHGYGMVVTWISGKLFEVEEPLSNIV